MNDFLTKAELYARVDEKALELGFDIYSQFYNMDAIWLAGQVCKNLTIELIEFNEAKICGILYKGKNSTTIGLNARRSAVGRNFDCMHEIIHYWFHDGEYFYCDLRSNSPIEWQANAGAAQFLMPYQSFIPAYSRMFDFFYGKNPPHVAQKKLIGYLANHYRVGEMAVGCRLEDLKPEIEQYLSGVAVGDLRVMTGARFRSMGDSECRLGLPLSN